MTLVFQDMRIEEPFYTHIKIGISLPFLPFESSISVRTLLNTTWNCISCQQAHQDMRHEKNENETEPCTVHYFIPTLIVLRPFSVRCSGV